MKIGMILDAIYPSDARISNECDELIKNGHEFIYSVFHTKKIILKRKL